MVIFIAVPGAGSVEYQRTPAGCDAARNVIAICDYRSFDERDGWRHAVAHAADLLMRLALNPALTGTQLDAV